MGGVFPHLAWKTLVHSHGGTRRGETPSLRSTITLSLGCIISGGSYPSSAGARHNGGAQAVELEDDLVFFRDPGHRAGPGDFD